jgi:hypothetical protein
VHALMAEGVTTPSAVAAGIVLEAINCRARPQPPTGPR